MDDRGIGPLRVQSDLHLRVGDVSADIIADGTRITVRTDDPARLFAEVAAAALPDNVSGPNLRDVVGRTGRLLNQAGLTAQLDGGSGVIVELGRGGQSRLSRVLFGSDCARLGSARAVVPAATRYLASSARRHTSHVVAGLAVAALLGGAAARRHTAQPIPSVATLSIPPADRR